MANRSSTNTVYGPKRLPRLRNNPRLDERGREILDPHSIVAEMAFRPPTLQEQIQRLNEAGRIHRFLPDDDYAEDDFGDDYDDLPDEGLTPYEIDGMGLNLQKEAPQPRKGKKGTPTPEPDESALGDPQESDRDDSDEGA